MRGPRFVRHRGRFRRIIAVTALTGAAATVALGGTIYYADGYVDVPGPACGGQTDTGCQLGAVDVPANDGETVPQCVQYCPWDMASSQPAEPIGALPAEPVTRVGGAPASVAPAAPVMAPTMAAEPVRLADVAPIQTLQHYAIVIQSAPAAGGKCVDVPDQQFMQGAPLQIWPCNGTPAQTFSYDADSKRLAIGGLCVAVWGHAGRPDDPLRLLPCNGGPSQTWYIRQNGAYVEFVGINGLCMDIMNASTPNPTPLIARTCQDQAGQSWTMHAAAQ